MPVYPSEARGPHRVPVPLPGKGEGGQGEGGRAARGERLEHGQGLTDDFTRPNSFFSTKRAHQTYPRPNEPTTGAVGPFVTISQSEYRVGPACVLSRLNESLTLANLEYIVQLIELLNRKPHCRSFSFSTGSAITSQTYLLLNGF